jgi:hypothetical protein|tara:strand:+ start:1696 stop:1800 length:105 start_codon:yes stop_codon:yes gene_type:complete
MKRLSDVLSDRRKVYGTKKRKKKKKRKRKVKKRA